MTVGLDYLIIACAYSEKNEEEHVKSNFEKAFARLIISGNELYLPEFFLARARIRYLEDSRKQNRSVEEALRDAKEALRIAKLHELPLYMADAYMILSQLNIEKEQIQEAYDYLEKAKSLVYEHQYFRQVSEIKMLEAQIAFLMPTHGGLVRAKRLLYLLSVGPYYDEAKHHRRPVIPGSRIP